MLWSFDGAGGAPGIAPDGSIYAGHTNTLYAINPDGTEKWRYDVGYRGGPNNSSEGVTIDVDGNVYVTNAQGILMSLSPEGQLRWSLDLAPDIPSDIYPSAPIIGGDGMLYVNAWKVISVVPEPATLSLLALGGLALIRRNRKGAKR